jgi:hypothetical protein
MTQAKWRITRADNRRWRRSHEFVASLYNILLRRSQIRAVKLFIDTQGPRVEHMLSEVTSVDIVSQALNSGECDNLKDVLKKKHLSSKLETMVHSMQTVQRNVRGSEAEKQSVRYKFNALRIWNGFSSLFFTLNPNDVKSPLTLALVDKERFHVKKFSLDMSDFETEQFLHDTLLGRPRLLHEIVAQDPLAATRCFHYTVRLVIETLFNCARPGAPHPDGVAANTLPGIFGHVSGYFGVVEPQMRKALHIHMLIQLHGFGNPEDLINSGDIASLFRRMWHYVASICFRSVEGFAAYTNEASAMDKLKSLPLLPLSNKQLAYLGRVRGEEAMAAQLLARGLDSTPPMTQKTHMKHFMPVSYRNATVPANEYAATAVAEINAGVFKAGNHVCLPHVCFKGRGVGKLGFCRMFFWHWTQVTKKNGELGAVRVHGVQLRPRWDGVGAVPVCGAPPVLGLPALEMNHPFHFKLTPSIMLGPRCNHDLGILLRFPTTIPATGSAVSSPEANAAWGVAVRNMVDGMVSREFYCSDYSTKVRLQLSVSSCNHELVVFRIPCPRGS